MKQEEPSIGRIVHAVIADKHGEPIVRPAIVVYVWDKASGCCNLQVFIDGSNDVSAIGPHGPAATLWKTSVLHSEEPQLGTWHWPPRVKPSQSEMGALE